MPLAHFTTIDSHNRKWEPIHKNLYETTILLPKVLQDIHGSKATSLLLENTKTAKFPTYPDLGQQTQRFKYSTRVFVMMPTQTHIEDLVITFNLNQNDDYQIFCFKMLKDWYDLAWNNETGTLHYKKNLTSDIIIHQHDKEGKVVRRVTYHNAMLKLFSGVEELSWEDSTAIMDMSCTFLADYWEDFYY